METFFFIAASFTGLNDEGILHLLVLKIFKEQNAAVIYQRLQTDNVWHFNYSFT